MPLKFALFENHLTSDPNDYMAMVQTESSKTIHDIIDRMISRGSTVTKAEALGVMEEFGLAYESILKEGYGVVTPEFIVRPSITGVFNGAGDSFDYSRHQVQLNVRLGSRLAAMASQVPVEKVSGAVKHPVPQKFKDIFSESHNQNLTPNGVGQLVGSLLKFDPADASQGIYFIKADGTETKVATTVKIKPAELIFVIPALTAGSYRLEVRAMYQGSQSLRSGSLEDSLTVA